MTAKLAIRIGLALAVVAAGVWVTLHRGELDIVAVQARIDALGVGAPLAFVVFYSLGALVFFPGSILTLAGGAVFGPVFGTIYSIVGATIGAVLAFLLSRYVSGDWVRQRAGKKLDGLLGGVEEQGWKFVALVRLIPLFPYNLLNYALGLSRIRLAHYAIASFVCMFPGALAYTYLG